MVSILLIGMLENEMYVVMAACYTELFMTYGQREVYCDAV